MKKHCHKVIIKMFTAARLPVSSTALSYLAEKFHQSSAVEAHQRLRSASSSSLVVHRTRLSTIGNRAFPIAASRLRNTLPPQNVTSASSLTVSTSRLKTYLFNRSFSSNSNNNNDEYIYMAQNRISSYALIAAIKQVFL